MISEKIDQYLETLTINESEYLEELDFEDTIELAEILDESNKSQFVGKLIGLGILKKENGKLVAVKKISRDEFISKHLKVGKVKKAGRKIERGAKKLLRKGKVLANV